MMSTYSPLLPQQQQLTTLERLPPELLTRVLRFLDDDSAHMLSATSAHLNRISNPVLWSNPHIPTRPVSPIEPLIARHGSHIRHLTFPDPTTVDLIAISVHVPNLLSLDLSGCAPYSVGDHHIMAILAACPRLIRVVLDDCLELTDRCLVEGLAVHPNLHAMRDISIARCVEITDGGAVAMIEGARAPGSASRRGARSLKTLNITCVPLLTEKLLMAVAANCPELECLKAADSDAVTDDSLAALAEGCDRLDTLDISECMGVTQTGFMEFERIREQKWINTDGSPCVYTPPQTAAHFSLLKLNRSPQDAVTNLALMALLPPIPKEGSRKAAGLAKRWGRRPSLEGLELSFARNISAEVFAHLGKNYQGTLTRLDLSNVTLRRDTSSAAVSTNPTATTDIPYLAAFLATQPRLRHLNLSGSPSLVSDDTCAAIGKSCRELVTLDLSECGGVTDQGVVAVAKGCRMLEDVNLKGCVDVGDASVEAFVVGDDDAVGEVTSKLKYLNLGLCAKLTDASVRLLADMCARPGTGMHTLKLSGCMEITDGGLDYMFEKISHNTAAVVTATATKDRNDPLRLLCLSGCFHITTPSLARLATSLPTLESINFYACPSVTDDAVVTIAKNCPRLKSIVMSKCTVSDVALEAVAEGCRMVHTVYAGFLGGRGVGDEGVGAVVRKCKEVKLLDVSGSRRVTEKAFLGEGGGGEEKLALQILLVRACQSVTFGGMCEVVGRCPRLQRLDVVGCGRIGAEERERLRVLVDERW